MVCETTQKANEIIDTESMWGRGIVKVSVPCSEIKGITVPHRTGVYDMVSFWSPLSVEDSFRIDEMCFSVSNEGGIDTSSVDAEMARYITIRRCLKGWDGRVLRTTGGWMEKEDWSRVCRFHPSALLVSFFIFRSRCAVSDDEEKLIDRQASILFATTSGTVNNPHPVISRYCAESSLWDKIGVSADRTAGVSMKDYSGMREVIRKESEIMRRK